MPAAARSAGSAGGHQAFEVAAGNDRLDFRGAGGNHDLPLRMNVEHAPGVVERDDQRARVDAGDVLPFPGVEGDHVLPRGTGVRSGPAPRVALADDHRVAVDVVGGRRFGLGSRLLRQQRRCLVPEVIPPNDHPGLRPHLATPRVGDAVDRRQAVRAVAAQAQTAASGRVQTGPQHGDQQAVARLSLDRLSVYL